MESKKAKLTEAEDGAVVIGRAEEDQDMKLPVRQSKFKRSTVHHNVHGSLQYVGHFKIAERFSTVFIIKSIELER